MSAALRPECLPALPGGFGEGLGLGRRCGALTPHPLDGFGEVREETSLARAQLSPFGTEAGPLRTTRSPSGTWSRSGALLGHVRAQPLAGRAWPGMQDPEERALDARAQLVHRPRWPCCLPSLLCSLSSTATGVGWHVEPPALRSRAPGQPVPLGPGSVRSLSPRPAPCGQL